MESNVDIPLTIVLEIFEHLDFRCLLLCRQVCSEFRDLVDSTSSFQYKIELALAGQEDGTLGEVIERRKSLKEHQERWAKLRWTQDLSVPQAYPGYWEICGNVLAQTREGSSLHLDMKRIPSQSRGIEERVWAVDIGKFMGEGAVLEDFAIDPGQDLLVAVDCVERNIRIHIRKLSTGEPHHLASEPIISTIGLSRTRSYYFEINGDIFSIMFHKPNKEVVIWNWKTGQILSHLVHNGITTMALLSERYLMLMILGQTQPYLMIVDFIARSPKDRSLGAAENTFIFRFPRLVDDDVYAFVQSNPRSTKEPGSESSVPFYASANERLFIAGFLVYTNGQALCIATFESSFLSLIKTGIQNDVREFDWTMWGPHHSGIIPRIHYSSTWILNSYGIKLACRYKNRVDVYDFNQLPVKKWQQTRSDASKGIVRSLFFTAPAKIEPGIFEERVETKLGYKITSWPIPGITNSSIFVMCSEDAVILVDENKDVYRLLTI